MSMKKIIASVAAAALTVSSLAVVGVSAESETKFDFVYDIGTMDVNYSKTINIRGGVDAKELFGITNATTAPVEFSFDHTLQFAVNVYGGFSTKLEQELNRDVFGWTYGSDGKPVSTTNRFKGNETTITVTGTTTTNRAITVKAVCNQWNWTPQDPQMTQQYFRVRHDGESAESVVLEAHDLDLTNVSKINSITVTTSFNVDTGEYSIANNAGSVKVNTTLDDQIAAHYGKFTTESLSADASYTAKNKKTSGKAVTVGNAYDFSGAALYNEDGTERKNPNCIIGYESNGNPISAYGFGYNTLRWVNDNIVQNRGAKLRFNFMKPDTLNDAISKGDIFTYPTRPNDKDHGSAVLTPDSSSSGSSTKVDMAIGVNLRNTTRLQDQGNIDTENYFIEFDWDELVKNSVATVSGNVDSIAFRIVETDNTKKIMNKDGLIGISSIQIIIPEQDDVAPVEKTIVVEDPVSGVKVEATPSVIRGNGGATLQAIGKLTTSNLTYEVELLDKNSIPVQPAGEVTLTLPIPKDNQGKTIKNGTVAHGLSNGTVENLPIINIDTYKTDGFVKVATKSFSPFTITFATFGVDFEEDETTTEAPETTTEAPETTTEAPETTTEAPAQTGSTNNGGEDKNVGTGVVLAVVPAAIAAAAVVISKKRK